MKPVTWVLLGVGALLVTAGVVEAFASSSPSAPPPHGKATKFVAMTGGHRYTLTITLAGPLTGQGTTQASAQAAVGSSYSVQSVSATPTTLELVVDCVTSAADPESVWLSAAQAPAGSTLEVVDNGPTPGIKGVPPKLIPLNASADGTTVQARVGDVLQISQDILTNGTPWSYSTSGAAVTQGTSKTTSQGKGTNVLTQTDTFHAAAAGTSTISAHDGGGQTFSVTVVVT